MSLFILLIILASCGSNQETVTYYLDNDPLLEKVTITAEDNKIIEHTIKNTINYEAAGYESKEEAQESINVPDMGNLQGIDGIETTATFEDDEFVYGIKYDLAVIDPSEVSDDLQEFLEEEEYWDFEIQVQELEDLGFEKKEE